MPSSSPGLSNAAFTGALAWWREAGLTHDFSDAAQDWLAAVPLNAAPLETKARREPHAPLPPGPAPAAPLALPSSLADFAPWWLAEPALAPGGLTLRVPPRGQANAALMVVVAEPEVEDRDRLLSGQQGKLLAGMLAAMGVVEADAYVASLLPRNLPAADWAELAAGPLPAVLAHHIALVNPARLITFGRVSTLIDHAPAQNPVILRSLNHDAAQAVRPWTVLAARDFAVLLARGPARAEFWRSWLEFSR